MSRYECHVNKVLSGVRKHYGKDDFVWYEVDVHYSYGNEEPRKKSLSFQTKKEAEQVKEGYCFFI